MQRLQTAHTLSNKISALSALSMLSLSQKALWRYLHKTALAYTYIPAARVFGMTAMTLRTFLAFRMSR